MTRNKHDSHRTPLGRLLRLASAQEGVFTTPQAIALGVTRSELATLVERGHARRRRRGLYVVAGAPETHARRVMEAILAGPPGCAASHESAASLVNWISPPSEVQITVGRSERLRLDGVVAHRSVLPPHHVARIGRIPVTSMARTIVDLASVSDLDRLAEIMDPLLVSKRLTPGRLLRVVDDIVEAPGRHGTALLRTALDVWTEPRRPGSAAEARLLRKLREQGHGDYVTQYEVRVGDRDFRLDVAWPERRACLEYSGKGFHGPRHWERDEDHAELIESVGWSSREVEVSDLVPGETTLWNWVAATARRSAA